MVPDVVIPIATVVFFSTLQGEKKKIPFSCRSNAPPFPHLSVTVTGLHGEEEKGQINSAGNTEAAKKPAFTSTVTAGVAQARSIASTWDEHDTWAERVTAVRDFSRKGRVFSAKKRKGKKVRKGGGGVPPRVLHPKECTVHVTSPPGNELLRGPVSHTLVLRLLLFLVQPTCRAKRKSWRVFFSSPCLSLQTPLGLSHSSNSDVCSALRSVTSCVQQARSTKAVQRLAVAF